MKQIFTLLIFITLVQCSHKKEKHIEIEYWPNGNKRVEVHQDYEGALDAEVFIFKKNGSLHKHFKMHDSVYHGYYNEFAGNGNLLLSMNYKNDVPIDSVILYDTTNNNQQIRRITIHDDLGYNKILKKVFYKNDSITKEIIRPFLSTYKSKTAKIGEPFIINFFFIDSIKNPLKAYLVKMELDEKTKNKMTNYKIVDSLEFKGKEDAFFIPKIDSTYKYFYIKFNAELNVGSLNNSIFPDSLVFD
ncbi:hypothetical protein [Aureibacter tunicatorum]|uniref:Uncharacterized protein n=1 Tax=Aureibacter tunicatorum TaxID=866807 RepID=A0AAE3XQY9_9BACT|nr:hypothetical protein [Aureibacter tunicatorum]MDR6240982.1 hypothetical protein [Aureibacter tunicatorum]BDD03761.1 hypothetical protein AUTU_12440 [Aureibacter tunicatorum]